MTDTATPDIRLAALHAALDWADDHAAHTGHNHLPEGAILSVASKFAQWITTGEAPRKPGDSATPAIPPTWGGVSAEAARGTGTRITAVHRG